MKIEKQECPHCKKSTESVKNGRVTIHKWQRYKCKTCGKTWSDTKHQSDPLENCNQIATLLMHIVGINKKQIVETLNVSRERVDKHLNSYLKENIPKHKKQIELKTDWEVHESGASFSDSDKKLMIFIQNNAISVVIKSQKQGFDIENSGTIRRLIKYE